MSTKSIWARPNLLSDEGGALNGLWLLVILHKRSFARSTSSPYVCFLRILLRDSKLLFVLCWNANEPAYGGGDMVNHEVLGVKEIEEPVLLHICPHSVIC